MIFVAREKLKANILIISEWRQQNNITICLESRDYEINRIFKQLTEIIMKNNVHGRIDRHEEHCAELH